jgi:hypothetical protein
LRWALGINGKQALVVVGAKFCLPHQQAPVSVAADDCFAHFGVAELTIELATFRWPGPARSSPARTIGIARFRARRRSPTRDRLPRPTG